MHGFCTDFARFQNVQRVQIVAKLDKGCRNCWVKNYVALIKNNDNSKLPETETNRRLALLISGPRVRVPGGAPQQQNPNFFPIGEGFGFFVRRVKHKRCLCIKNTNCYKLLHSPSFLLFTIACTLVGRP